MVVAAVVVEGGGRVGAEVVEVEVGAFMEEAGETGLEDSEGRGGWIRCRQWMEARLLLTRLMVDICMCIA